MIHLTLFGAVRVAESGVPVAGVVVAIVGRERGAEQPLGSAVTGPDGAFHLVVRVDDIDDLVGKRYEIGVRVLTGDRATELWSGEVPLHRHAGEERVEIRIPEERLGGTVEGPRLRIIGDGGEERRELTPGESLVIHASGLRPSVLHTVTISDRNGELFTATVMSNALGVVDPTAVWPLLGLEDPRSTEPVSFAEARKRWDGAEIELVLRHGEQRVAHAALRLGDTLRRPLVVGSDGKGFPLHGFEVSEHPARVAILDPPPWEAARVWMVPRQHVWRTGDRIAPVTLRSGRLAAADVALRDREMVEVTIAEAEELDPGAYDFVVRQLRYGSADDDAFELREADLVGGRLVTGLVVRERFWPSKMILGGCVNQQRSMVGRFIGIWPYMAYSDTFQIGENIWAALDPAALDPSLISKMVALYTVPHKTPAQWSVDSSLTNLAVLGGNAAVPKWLTQSWCINANLRLLWPNASQVGEYDVVADFDNNTGNPMAFVPDNSFDPPLDLIDGYTNPGFRIVPDPTNDTSFANVGSFTYDETTQGYITVTADSGITYSNVPLRASVRFPSDVPGATSPAQISAASPNYPVVVIVHGNYTLGLTSYLGYEYLLDHLGRNGFICASIYMQPGEEGTDRARIARRHLQILFTMFGAHAANNVGLMGHSRGGEAVVIAARLNQQEAWGYNINAVISLAPTNQYTFEHFGGAWAVPYMVIYGSLDGDLSGIGDTGFELYDHASGMKKSMMFIYEVCHDRFNTVWGDWDIGNLAPTDQTRVVSATTHHDIAKGYMSAFFRENLRGDTEWAGLLRGEWSPAQLQIDTPGLQIYPQYEDTTVRTVDDFDGPHTATSWQTSDMGAAVTQAGLPATPQDNDLRTMDLQSPHLTGGLLVRWNAVGESLRYAIPAGQGDVRGYQAVSFRITQRVNSASNPASQAQDLRLTLTDGGGKSRAIRISKFTQIPYPDVRADGRTKSAMRTVRIPLSAYTIKCLNIDPVDISNVVSLSFDFSEKPTGEIEIDSIQFTS